MRANEMTVSRVQETARGDYESVVSFAQELVRIPSRGGIDPYDPVLNCMEAWLDEHGIGCRRLCGPGGSDVALVSEISGSSPGPRFVLDACLDTAPFGDENAWRFRPASGEIADGWLHGRGSSDSKTGASIFAHVAARLRESAGDWAGSVVLLFDVDEHTGVFGGAKAFFGSEPGAQADGVMIGYPGPEHVVTGGRGLLRARTHVHGVAGHSGSSKVVPSAIVKASSLVSRLHAAELPGPGGEEFPLPAKLTVTEIRGGEGYSTVPDLCVFNVDIRLTPAFGEQEAMALIRSAAAEEDSAWPGTQPTYIDVTTHWPPFALPDHSPLRAALLSAAADSGLHAAPKIAGPSNIGNYLAGLGIPATAGFGVTYEGLHGTDERVDLASVTPVHAAYHLALLELLTSA